MMRFVDPEYQCDLLRTCRTIADFCCFAMAAANVSGGAVSLDIFPHIERDLCSAQPWLVLHKVRLRLKT